MRLLIISHENPHIQQAVQIAQKKCANVRLCSRNDEALSALRNGQGADLLLVDVSNDVPGLIRALRAERFAVPVIACGVSGTNSKIAVDAIKAGAKEFVPLPADQDLIAAVIEAIAPSSKEESFIAEAPAMKSLLVMAKQVAGSEASILITGESGTGKEVLASYIHQMSKRSDQPFVAVNCAAIPEQLLESELFGHEKGAFTGAINRRVGKFEEASKGTLLLDEITEMDIKMQPKLLRAIQQKQIDRVGGASPVPVDIRIIATSNRDMREAISKGIFREDLYYRLNVINLQIPSLRQRKEDVLPLTHYFIKKFAVANGIEIKKLDEGAALKLQAYDWPGNVRELENTIHRAVLLAVDGVIMAGSVLLEHCQYSDTIPSDAPQIAGDLVGRTIESVEKELIINTLGHCLGNRTQAAHILGISIRTLRNKLQTYQVEGA